jgi:hypothetical protein
MTALLLLAAGLVPVGLGLGWWLRRRPRRRTRPAVPAAVSPVSRQHLHFLQGGDVNAAAVEATKQ